MAGVLLRVFGVLLMLSALALPLMQAPDREVQTLVARWAPPPSDFLDLRGQLVHFRDEGPRGDPAPLVLLHGTSASLHTWEGWTRALRGQRRVISFDLPGFGLTGPWSGAHAGRAYRADEWARFTLELLDALQVRRFVVGGNSLGGEVAWRVALLAPQRAAGLLLVDSAGLPYAPEGVPLGWRLAVLPGLDYVFEHLLPRPLVRASAAAVYGDPARLNDALVERYFELTLRTGNRRALVDYLRLARAAGTANDAAIATLKLPTLILWGGRDRIFPPAIAQRFHDAVAGSQLQVFDTLGHVPHEEDPAATVVPVKAFLAGLPTSEHPQSAIRRLPTGAVRQRWRQYTTLSQRATASSTRA